MRDYAKAVWGVELDEQGKPVPQVPLEIELSDDDEPPPRPKAPEPSAAEAFDIADSDEEDPERVPEDSGPFPPLPPARRPGAPVEEPSEEAAVACHAAKQAASEAAEDGDDAMALQQYTVAIMTGAASALLFVRRAELLLKQRRPNAAVRDCSAALEVNMDCGKAYRVRGMAHRRIGRWQAAHQDISLGQKLDYEDSAVELQKLVAEKATRAAERRAAIAKDAPGRKRHKG